MMAHRVMTVACVLALAAAAPALAQESWVDLSATRQTTTVSSIEAEIEYAAGVLTVFPAATGLQYDVRMRYDGGRFRPLRDWSNEGGIGHFRVGVQTEEGLHIDFKNLPDMDLDEQAGSLSVGLGTEVPTRLSITVGAARSKLELGGLRLTELKIETGASESHLSFDQPNSARMKTLKLSAGIAAFEATGLGNARFDSLEFEGGMGDITLDFGGKWSGDARARVSLGLGSLHIIVPPELGVRILRRSTFLTSFDAPGFTRSGKRYTTPNWGDAAHHLVIQVKSALGSIDVEVARRH